MIVANVSHTMINCTCKNQLGFSFLPFTLIPQYLERFNWSIQLTFQTVRRMREAWLFGLSLFRPSQQSNIPTSVPRRAKKDSKFPLPGVQDRSSALPQGQERPVKSPPHELPAPPPAPRPSPHAGFTLISASVGFGFLALYSGFQSQWFRSPQAKISRIPESSILGDPDADKVGEGKSKRVEKCICATFSRPFRLSLVPTICPWVSEDGNPDALTWGERIHVMQLARNKLFCCLTKHFKSSWWHLWSLVTLEKILVGEKNRSH